MQTHLCRLRTSASGNRAMATGTNPPFITASDGVMFSIHTEASFKGLCRPTLIMPATVVLGAQWGDEGKGKLVDQLASEADWVVRFQGGSNAGHTIVIGERKLAFHHLPSGITYSHCNLVLGDGMVIDPWKLEQELDSWFAFGGERPEGERLFISERAHITLPYHRILDGADKDIGTTGRGIGPTYRDAIDRIGIRFVDLPSVLKDDAKITSMVNRMNSQLTAAGLESSIDKLTLTNDLEWIQNRFGASVRPTGVMVDHSLKRGEFVLLEGAQGALLDISQGTYPYVTSSVTSRANATHGAGVHPGHVNRCIGVVKAYTTRVGHGPFPSELADDVGKHLGEVGHEFGTTTGRPRRCGWLDIVPLRHAMRVNGFDEIVLTKLDVLGGIEEIEIVIGYDIDGSQVHEFPADIGLLEKATPVTMKLPGFSPLSLDEWLKLSREARATGQGYSVLPQEAQVYIETIEKLLGVPVTSVGVGPDREASIEKSE